MDTLMNEAREALLQRRSSLRGLLRDNRGMNGGLRGGWAPHPEDGVMEARAGAVLDRLSEHEQRELLDIDDALMRIEQGRFGHCARCGGAIGRHRLRAVPEARHCMTCSTQMRR